MSRFIWERGRGQLSDPRPTSPHTPSTLLFHAPTKTEPRPLPPLPSLSTVTAVRPLNPLYSLLPGSSTTQEYTFERLQQCLYKICHVKSCVYYLFVYIIYFFFSFAIDERGHSLLHPHPFSVLVSVVTLHNHAAHPSLLSLGVTFDTRAQVRSGS